MISKNPNFIATIHKETLNIEHVADMLGISTATVHNWVKSGELPRYEKSNNQFFYRADIEKLQSKLLSGDLERLNKRANKIKAKRTFIPEEHIKTKASLNEFNHVIYFIQKNHIKIDLALFLLSLNVLKKEKILLTTNLQKIKKVKELVFTNKQIQKEIHSWSLDFKNKNIKPHFSFLLDFKLPSERDILGVFYQSLLFEGKKSQIGSYYTPKNVINNIIKNYVKEDSKVLDPCSGTGQFLLAFSDIVKNPLNIYGIDCDKTAVRIARLNLLIKFKNKDFVPNIFCKNTLFDTNSDDFSHNYKDIKSFDVIATNPPFGARFSKEEKSTLRNMYPEISSFESFSYFLIKSLNWLNSSGVISFILPESILNVRTHKDIRKIILKTTQVKKITYLNRIFKNVFTPVISLDLQKTPIEKEHTFQNGLSYKAKWEHKNHTFTFKKKRSNKSSIKKLYKEKCKTLIQNKNKKYKVNQIRWASNLDFIFDIDISSFDQTIIEKIYKTNHTTLKHQADWALGIVTGNNKKFITTENKSGFEPIYKGKDIKKLLLDNASFYIQFQPENLQQVASEEKYRAEEKLIYKFISKNLVFAYDSHKLLTLNSANIVIPKIPSYPIKVITSLFNSSLYQFLFQKKFSSIKVLRSHLEDLPLPLWDKEVFSKITKLADQVIQKQNTFQELDNYITSKFSLSKKEIAHINNEIK